MTKAATVSNVNSKNHSKEVIEKGIDLVKKVTSSISYKHRLKDSEELYSYLMSKLVNILNKYEYERNIPFECFARKSLNGHAFNFIRDHSRTVRVPRKYSELNLQYNALLKKNPKLKFEEAVKKLGVKSSDLLNAMEASQMTFAEINDYREFVSGLPDENLLVLNYLKHMDYEMREILEEIYIDQKPMHRVFQKRKISVAEGQKRLSEVLDKIQSLRDE